MFLAVAALPAVAEAVPPANDNYVDSQPVNRRGTVLPTNQLTDTRDTTEASVQSDLFSPPSSGGGPENTACGTMRFGKTVWYDFYPDVVGFAELQSAGFPTAMAVYEFDPDSSRPTRLVKCGRKPAFLVPVETGRAYTVQVGGIDEGSGAVGGRLQFTFEFFRDLETTVTLTRQPVGNGIIVRRLSVKAPEGSHASLRCRKRCSIKQGRNARARGAKTVSFTKLRGRFLPAGASIELRITRPDHVGDYVRFDVTRGGVKRIDRCLRPGSTEPRKTCA